LKIVYHDPKSMEELVSFDPHLVVGILGGGAGTTYDAFKLLAEAQKYGARAALFGRKINSAECQLAFVEFLRLIANGVISPEEAVRAYHGVLGKLNIKPRRKLEDDLTLQTNVMSYGSTSASVPNAIPKNPSPSPQSPAPSPGSCSCGCNGKKPGGCGDKTATSADKIAYDPAVTPDFARMTQAEKLAYNKLKRDHIYGHFGARASKRRGAK
jgi:hypothetical protein